MTDWFGKPGRSTVTKEEKDLNKFIASYKWLAWFALFSVLVCVSYGSDASGWAAIAWGTGLSFSMWTFIGTSQRYATYSAVKISAELIIGAMSSSKEEN